MLDKVQQTKLNKQINEISPSKERINVDKMLNILIYL